MRKLFNTKRIFDRECINSFSISFPAITKHHFLSLPTLVTVPLQSHSYLFLNRDNQIETFLKRIEEILFKKIKYS